MNHAVRLLLLGAVCLLLAACAKLTDAEVTWCAYHEDEVRSAARTLGTEDQIEWRRQAGAEQYQFDSTFADACRAALMKDPTATSD